VREPVAATQGETLDFAAQLKALRSELEQLSAANTELAEQRDRYHALYLQMLEQCEKLSRGLLGRKAERFPADESQLTLQLLGLLLRGDEAPLAPPPTQPVRAHERAKPTGRQPLPETLPRVEIEVLPEEVKRGGLDAFERIGEERSEIIERRPASLVVVQTIRGKFVRKGRERAAQTQVHIAELPELPIERGLAGPGMLADTVVRRWQDHLPLHRLERIYAREGLELSRQTICGWHLQLRELVQPVVEAMWADARSAPYLCTDATGVRVQAKGECRNGHFFVVVAPERSVLFAYSPRHDGVAVDRLLGGYQGYLVADAHSVYDHLYRDGQVVEVGCWAHCRRYFYRALETEPERAREALALIGELFRIERELKELPSAKRKRLRTERSKPVVDAFFAWCERCAPEALDDTPLAKGIGYARNQRQALERFLGDGRLPIHNNLSEGQLRRQAIGRANWTFLGSDEGGAANATFVSLLASCPMHRLEPWSYLRDLLILLPRWPLRHALELAPLAWRDTLRRDDVQQRLAAHPYRKVTQGPSG
jgi:transposase